MIGAIVDDLYIAAGGAHVSGPGEGIGAPPEDADVQRKAETGAIVSCLKSGYLQHVDHVALVAAARAADALIVLRFRPGQFVLRGEPLAALAAPGNFHGLEAAVERSARIGRHRTLTQDSEFGIAQVVEIAIRALSPAVNDTFTGVACVDWLADALLTLAERPPLEGNWYDTGGTLRVWMPPVRLERLVKLAFDQIRQASTTTPAVLIRQLDTIRRLAPRLDAACRQALSEQADAIKSTQLGAGRARRSMSCPSPRVAGARPHRSAGLRSVDDGAMARTPVAKTWGMRVRSSLTAKARSTLRDKAGVIWRCAHADWSPLANVALA
jgi:hypothetical protein